jgi:phosphoenolpyruvate carboxykinase (diphosphate)
VVDLNNALVAFDPDRYGGSRRRPGCIGPHYPGGPRRQPARAGDLVPHASGRAGARVPDRERYLEKVNDFEHEGRTVQASRLGYRITPLFVDRFLGRIFEIPGAVFPQELLRPELTGRSDVRRGD